MNELIFFYYILTICSFILVALKIGKHALIGLICLQSVLANLFVLKEINLFGFTATASDALAVGITLSLNILQEYFKKEITLKTIWVGFFCTVFYTICSLFQIAYIPALTDISSQNFDAILSFMPRITIASLFVYLIVQNIDCRLYGYLCKRFEYKNFILRNYSSVAITQLLDTILFSFLGLYKLNQSYSDLNIIFQIIIVSYLIKLMVIIISGPFLALSKKIYKNF